MLTPNDSFHDWAMFYQNKGVPIFPLRPFTKMPYGESQHVTKENKNKQKGLKKYPLGDFAARIRRASKEGIVPTPEDVDGFWSTPGGMYANIGFFPSWVVIDVDSKPDKANGADTLKELLSEYEYNIKGGKTINISFI